MKRLIVLLALLAVFFSCYEEGTGQGADKAEAEQTAQLMEEAHRQIGLPNIVNFQQRKTYKMIQEECDKENLICYAYIKSEYTGRLIYIGKCIGYGVPFSAQYTNPQRRIGTACECGYMLPQADPNGLFMPTSSSATWLMMIDPKDNKPRPVYIEQEILVSPFKLTEGI